MPTGESTNTVSELLLPKKPKVEYHSNYRFTRNKETEKHFGQHHGAVVCKIKTAKLLDKYIQFPLQITGKEKKREWEGTYILSET